MNPPPAPGRRLLWALAAAFVVLTIAGAVVGTWWYFSGGPGGLAAGDVPPDPRLTYQGPFLNVHPEVQYVGDAACAECHHEIAKAYKESAMGRSMRPVTALAAEQRYGQDVNNPFEALGFHFRVERKGERVWHHQYRNGPGGEPLLDFSLEAHYVIGSGTRGYSYVSDRDGFLFQTAISWFSQKQIWDKSPGFAPDRLCGRPLVEACLFCHANRAQVFEGTQNHYDRPFASGFAIGCERCHGPGGLHVEQGGGAKVAGVNPTVVNPARLDHTLREAVCQQCHLEGEARVLRRGRSFAEFRPGLPLESVLAVFVHADESGERAVTHVEQMYLSACFRKSQGAQKMGCITCHDPHRKVAAEDQVRFYRDRCLQCHADHDCTETPPKRAAKKDSCADCHMPRFQSSDIVHTAGTDHRVIRPGKAKALGHGGSDRLEPFVPKGLPAGDRELNRDLGLALLESAGGNSARRKQGLALTAKACADFPDDLEALQQQGTALVLIGKMSEGSAVLKKVLERDPDREAALAGYAVATSAEGKLDLAIDTWRQAVAVNRWAPLYRGQLVSLLARKGAWKDMRPQAQTWLNLDPFSLEARKAWIMVLVKEGQLTDARGEYERARALHPFNQVELQAWFEQLQR